ncbi:uncharacterized protein LOC113203392 [Frankliniella occidentalis]|uniref:Uncharacterized protein LOC113203392 n=1 Tax=Frankliniella occidentalis TaxID=133901 RepID=A0A9C6UA47_FRAOC|nr:uncharacterized protein LOC113203392 [Frankliniella occidentalis]
MNMKHDSHIQVANKFQEGSALQAAAPWSQNPLEHASGIERAQLVAELGGDADPFDAEPGTRGVGTRACPTVVTSCNAFRYVGCVCHPAEPVVTWMVLWRGVPARCRCGFWWRLDPKEPFFDDPCASHH